MAEQTTPIQLTNPVQTEGLQLERMRESPHVWGDTDFSEVEEKDLDETKIFWMGTRANMEDTPQEDLERRLAIQDQVRKGILDEFGLPTGFTYDELGVPKEKQDEINAIKAQRAAQQRAAGIPTATPPVKKEYRNKYERKMDRQKMRDEAKRQEKLARANAQIRQHQIGNPIQNPSTAVVLTNR